MSRVFFLSLFFFPFLFHGHVRASGNYKTFYETYDLTQMDEDDGWVCLFFFWCLCLEEEEEKDEEVGVFLVHREMMILPGLCLFCFFDAGFSFSVSPFLRLVERVFGAWRVVSSEQWADSLREGFLSRAFSGLLPTISST